MNEVVEHKQFDLSPQSLDEALRFAEILAKSTIVPKDFANNPGNILVAIQWGMELGLKPMQAMQNIAVINGRPSVWGDAVLAMVLASPACKDVIERIDGEGDNLTAVCIAQRHGREDKVGGFSMADAKKAGLSGKSGPWSQYPRRMLQMRARAFALRDQFADILKGMPIAEEVMDTPTERDITPRSAAASAKQIEHYPAEKFDQMLPAWRDLIESGKKSADQVIATVQSKAPLSEEQIKKIRGEVTEMEGADE